MWLAILRVWEEMPSFSRVEKLERIIKSDVVARIKSRAMNVLTITRIVRCDSDIGNPD